MTAQINYRHELLRILNARPSSWYTPETLAAVMHANGLPAPDHAAIREALRFMLAHGECQYDPATGGWRSARMRSLAPRAGRS